PEAVLRRGQRTDRTDLDGVAGEVRLERLARGRGRRGRLQVRGLRRADLLLCAALQQVDERVTGDLLGEPGAALAQHAAFAVEQDLRGDPQRLGERALAVDEPGVGPAVCHRLVLQRALAALVADRAVQRVVD